MAIVYSLPKQKWVFMHCKVIQWTLLQRVIKFCLFDQVPSIQKWHGARGGMSEAGINWKLKDVKYFIYLKQVGT